MDIIKCNAGECVHDKLYVYRCESYKDLVPIQIQKTNWTQAKKIPSFFVCFSFSSNIAYYTDYPQESEFGAIPMCAEKCINKIVNLMFDQILPLFFKFQKISYRIKGCYSVPPFDYSFSDIEKLDINNCRQLIDVSIHRYFGFYRCMSSIAVYLWVPPSRFDEEQSALWMNNPIQGATSREMLLLDPYPRVRVSSPKVFANHERSRSPRLFDLERIKEPPPSVGRETAKPLSTAAERPKY